MKENNKAIDDHISNRDVKHQRYCLNPNPNESYLAANERNRNLNSIGPLLRICRESEIAGQKNRHVTQYKMERTLLSAQKQLKAS